MTNTPSASFNPLADPVPAPPKILILGVGNILYSDEGLGVRAVEYLQKHAEVPENVTLMDGGTRGMLLMYDIMGCDKLIILDAVLGPGGPGSMYRLDGDEVRKSLGFKDSMHQTDLLDTLMLCHIAGHQPDTVVLGMQPGDYTSLDDSLTPEIRTRIPDLVQAVVNELAASNVFITLREE